MKVFQYIDFKHFSTKSLKSMLAYSWPMIPNSLSNWVMNLSDRVIITEIMGLEANAVYSVANKIPNLFTSIQGTFVMAWQENASIASKDDDIATYYSKMFDAVFCILFALMACLIAFTPLMFRILIRGDYDEAYYQMPILFIALLFSTVASFVGGIYVACKQTKSIGITTIVAACINFIVNISLIKLIGLYAGSISTLVSFLVLAIFRMINIRKFVDIRYKIIKLVGMTGILCVISFLCYQRSTILDVVNIVLALVLSCLFNKEVILELMGKLKKKIIRKR